MVHKYKMNGYMIAVDSCNGAVYALDAVTYDILDYFNDMVPECLDEEIFKNLGGKYSKIEINEAYNELYDSFKKGFIFSKDMYKEMLDSPFLNSPIKAMCLNISHDCNMSCEYCFASKGDFGCRREVMPLETAKKAIDFLIKNSAGRENLEVEFFGGEPLIAFKTVKDAVKYARSLESVHNKNFKFTITTNGLLLTDDIINFINEEISAVVLSLDGRKEVNDKIRKTLSGNGSYDYIVPKFKKLISKRKNKEYYIRGTFTRYNLDFYNDVMHLYSLGFNNISIEPVVGKEELDYSIKPDDIKIICKEYEKLCVKICDMKSKGSNINFYRFDVDLKRTPCALKRLKGCSCGNEFIAVSPNGDIFPCHQFVGEPKFIMGNLNFDVFDMSLKKGFSEINFYKKEDCKDCWAKIFCGGGCNANNFHYMGDLLKPYKFFCEIEKKRIECALMLNVALKH